MLQKDWGSLVAIACLQANGLLVGTRNGCLELGENAGHCERGGGGTRGRTGSQEGLDWWLQEEEDRREDGTTTANVSLYIAGAARRGDKGVATQRGARGSIQVAARYAWQTGYSRAAMHLERGYFVGPAAAGMRTG